IGKDCLIAAGALIVKNAEPGRLYKGSPAKPSEISTIKYFKINEPDYTELSPA
ncbi:MAG: hypothetical protein ACYCQI_03645, partial [Gammaproteobacteria bacterium]